MKISRIREVKLPERGTVGSAGIDFFIPKDFPEVVLEPQRSILIPSGIKVNIPKGMAMIAFNKSGIATKHKCLVGACVVDEDYQGEVHIHLINSGDRPVILSPDMKIIQFVVLAIDNCILEEVELNNLYLEESERGTGGFGSTGE